VIEHARCLSVVQDTKTELRKCLRVVLNTKVKPLCVALSIRVVLENKVVVSL
jgi:hypothetical protein